MIIKSIKNILTISLVVILSGCGEGKAPINTQLNIQPRDFIQTQECSFFNDGACVNKDEVVDIYKSYASINESSLEYSLELRGWIYEPNSSTVARSAFLTLLEKSIGKSVTVPLDIDTRIDPFLADNQSDEVIKVAIGSKVYALKASLSSGYISGEIHISAQEAQIIFQSQNSREYIAYRVLLPSGDTREFKGRVDIVSNDGVIIVSDIDDTIKVSEVYVSESRLLENIFYNDVKSVPGMSDFFQTLKDENESPLFFYVSGSPKQMYQSIETFLEKEKFPKGYTFLKDFQLSPLTSSFYTFLDSNSTYEHKLKNIRALFEEFPRREFILVGDSGEKDPEVYATLLKEYDSRIKSIYIRNVTGESLDNERFQKIFPLSTEKVMFK